MYNSYTCILDRQFVDLARTHTTSTSDSPILSTVSQNGRATYNMLKMIIFIR